MDIESTCSGSVLHVRLSGRLDAYGANQLNDALSASVSEKAQALLLDFSAVNYLSSAGIRVLLMLYKDLKIHSGVLALANLQPYCMDVIRMTGFADAFPSFKSIPEADEYARRILRENGVLDHWSQLEEQQTDSGTFRFIPGTATTTAAEILGDIRDILHSRITSENIYSKRFFDKEYSIGMGGLGAHLEDYINLLGEMITIGGTMVWLPTDGNDTADFLIPQTDQGDVMLRTGFNVSITGGFNELALFKSTDAGGTPFGTVYRRLFELAARRRPDFRGALGLAARAQMSAVYGSGIKHSAVISNAPANGKMIIHGSNMAHWFDSDSEPRHRNTTALIVGIGADLTADLSDYNEEDFNRVFYLHPVNIGCKQELLHNHAVLFNEQPMPEHPVDMDQEIKSVIEQGEFLDMRHLLDSSTVTEALIGISYLQDFRSDPSGVPLDQPDSRPPIPEVIKREMKYYQP